jgi:hypothetical protein
MPTRLRVGFRSDPRVKYVSMPGSVGSDIRRISKSTDDGARCVRGRHHVRDDALDASLPGEPSQVRRNP